MMMQLVSPYKHDGAHDRWKSESVGVSRGWSRSQTQSLSRRKSRITAAREKPLDAHSLITHCRHDARENGDSHCDRNRKSWLPLVHHTYEFHDRKTWRRGEAKVSVKCNEKHGRRPDQIRVLCMRPNVSQPLPGPP